MKNNKNRKKAIKPKYTKKTFFFSFGLNHWFLLGLNQPTLPISIMKTLTACCLRHCRHPHRWGIPRDNPLRCGESRLQVHRIPFPTASFKQEEVGVSTFSKRRPLRKS